MQQTTSDFTDESVPFSQHDVNNNHRSLPDPAADDTEAVVGTVAHNNNGSTMNETSCIRLNSRTNFVIMSLLFSANHGCVVACLSLATARLGGALGAWQSGLL
jgi:hypothetical protein